MDEKLKGTSKMHTLISAARAVVHQRDYRADHGHFDTTQPNPDAEPDQCFDDWAADILSQALITDGVVVSGV